MFRFLFSDGAREWTTERLTLFMAYDWVDMHDAGIKRCSKDHRRWVIGIRERKSMFWVRKMHLNLFRWRKALAVMENIAGGLFIAWVTLHHLAITFDASIAESELSKNVKFCETKQMTKTLITKQPQRHFENGLLFCGSVCCGIEIISYANMFFPLQLDINQPFHYALNNLINAFNSNLLFFKWTARFFSHFFLLFALRYFYSFFSHKLDRFYA